MPEQESLCYGRQTKNNLNKKMMKGWWQTFLLILWSLHYNLFFFPLLYFLQKDNIYSIDNNFHIILRNQIHISNFNL